MGRLVVKAGIPIAFALAIIAHAPPSVTIMQPSPKTISTEARKVPAEVWIQGSDVAAVNAIVIGLNEHAPLGTVYYPEGKEI